VEIARTYYYSAFAYDHELNHASAVHCADLVPDTFPPELSLGVFQNPYLTQYLDIYLLCSEPADPATVYIKVGPDSLGVESVQGRQDIWMGEHTLTEGGSLIIIGHAADTTGNSISVSTDFSAGYITPLEGGSIGSADGRLRLTLPPRSVKRGAYVTIVCPGAYFGPGALAPAPEAGRGLGACLSGNPGGTAGQAYRIGPQGILSEAGVRIEMSYGDAGDPNVRPDRYYIEQEGVGALESFIDAEGQRVTATVTALGTFRLRLGRPGSSKIFDPGFLRLAPCRPNPSAGETTVSFEIRAPQRVRIAVYDVAGRLVSEIVDKTLGPGTHTSTWNAETPSGRSLPSGIYFLRASTEHSQVTTKLALIK
jgi:hypothetical protein